MSKRYVFGPALELDLLLGLGVEVNALYRRQGYETSFSNFASSIVAGERANSWEFPVLIKYRLPFPLVRPFVEGGYAPRTIRGSITSVNSPLPPLASPTVRSTAGTNWPVSHGLVAGAGVRFGIGRLRLAPVIRYTHWNNAAISGSYPDGPAWQSTQNQLDLLVGIGWKIR